MSSPIVTLITDFGTTDEYVGVIKGVLLSRNRDIAPIDISHSVRPQDINGAAYYLQRSYPYFPVNTVHLVVVDPGVGSSRHILAMKTDNHFFVGPDNGVFSFLLREKTDLTVYRVKQPEEEGNPVSATFHARDIMAPVAAHLATTHDLQDIGDQVSVENCTQQAPQAYIQTDNIIYGRVINIDHFGNLATNIPRAALDNKTVVVARITIGNRSIESLSHSYYQAPRGSILALFDSNNFLEIAVNQGNAADHLSAEAGTEVIVELGKFMNV